MFENKTRPSYQLYRLKKSLLQFWTLDLVIIGLAMSSGRNTENSEQNTCSSTETTCEEALVCLVYFNIHLRVLTASTITNDII